MKPRFNSLEVRFKYWVSFRVLSEWEGEPVPPALSVSPTVELFKELSDLVRFLGLMCVHNVVPGRGGNLIQNCK